METNEILLKIYELLLGQNTNDWRVINGGRQQSSYKEFNIYLKAGETYTLNNPFNFFRCLSSTGNFKVAWSSNQMETDFYEGLQAHFATVLPYVQFFNPSSAPITLKVGLGIGDFDDSRLSITGAVQTYSAQYSFFNVEQQTFDSTGQIEIAPAQKIIIQNTGGDVIYIGGTGTDGLQLQPQGTFEYSLNTALTIYGTDTQTATIGSFN